MAGGGANPLGPWYNKIMDNNLHLTVINPDGSFNCDLIADHRTDVRWVGKGYVAWRAVRLLWWDDASYIDYQCRDIED